MLRLVGWEKSCGISSLYIVYWLRSEGFTSFSTSLGFTSLTHCPAVHDGDWTHC
jgi:hypothetical protein